MHYDDKEQLEKWAQMYEKAQAEGKFKNAENLTPSPKTSEESFFGLHNTHPTDKPTDQDVKYWSQVNKQVANPYVLNEKIDPNLAREWRRQSGLSLPSDYAVIVESKEEIKAPEPPEVAKTPEPVIEEVVKAPEPIVESQEDVANVAKSILQTPNPIRAHTVGADQALEPGPLGLTFSEEDVKNLDALKIQLYEMECKLNDFEGRGQNAAKFKKQIDALKAKIDDLSTAMTQSFPYSISPQGD